MPLPPPVDALATERLSAVDAAVPGLVTALWITGSAVSGPRLHATLATGEVLSKTAAGRYVADRFPAYAELAARCVAWRAGAEVAFATPDGLAAAELVREVVASAG